MILNALFENNLHVSPDVHAAFAVPRLLCLIDEQHAYLRTKVQETCDGQEQRHHALVLKRVDEAEQRLHCELRAKGNELEQAGNALQDVSVQCRTAESAVERMMVAIDGIQNIRQHFIMQRKVYYAWNAFVKKRRRKTARIEQAERHHALVSLQGRPVAFWRHLTRVERHSRAKKEVEASLRRQEDAIYAAANARIEALQAEADKSAALAEREVRLRLEVEKRMKDCFLRGVSALNLEAAEIVQTSPSQQSEGQTARQQVAHADNMQSNSHQLLRPHRDFRPPPKRRAVFAKASEQLFAEEVTAKTPTPVSTYPQTGYPTLLDTSLHSPSSPVTEQSRQRHAWSSQGPTSCAVRRSWPFSAQQQPQDTYSAGPGDLDTPRKSFPQPMLKN